MGIIKFVVDLQNWLHRASNVDEFLVKDKAV